MTHQSIVGLTFVAIAASSLTMAETPVTPSRDEYDAYLAAFTMEQHVVSCRKHAPGVYSSLAEEIETWRSENGLTKRRLEAAARRWPLPGGQSLDALLEHISVSMDEYYAVGKGELTDTRCQRLLDRLAASNNALEQTRGQ